MPQYLHRYGCTQEELAGRLKIDRSTVANLIRLLELPAAVQDAVRSGAVSQGHARALLPLGDEQVQREYCDRIQRDGLSVRARPRTWCPNSSRPKTVRRTAASDTVARRPKARTRSSQLAALEQELRTALGTKVDVRTTAAGRGKIVIHFTGPDEFERSASTSLVPAFAARQGS